MGDRDELRRANANNASSAEHWRERAAALERENARLRRERDDLRALADAQREAGTRDRERMYAAALEDGRTIVALGAELAAARAALETQRDLATWWCDEAYARESALDEAMTAGLAECEWLRDRLRDVEHHASLLMTGAMATEREAHAASLALIAAGVVPSRGTLPQRIAALAFARDCERRAGQSLDGQATLARNALSRSTNAARAWKEIARRYRRALHLALNESSHADWCDVRKGDGSPCDCHHAILERAVRP